MVWNIELKTVVSKKLKHFSLLFLLIKLFTSNSPILHSFDTWSFNFWVNFQSIGPWGRCFLYVNFSICVFVCLCVCSCVCMCVCKFLRYRLNVFLPPLSKLGCPIFLEIWNPWGESIGKKWSHNLNLLLKKGVKWPHKKNLQI